MKKLLIILLLSIGAYAQTSTVSGYIRSVGRLNANTRTYLRFTLAGCSGNQPRVNGEAILYPTGSNVYYQDFAVNLGYFSGTIYRNDYITCGGSTSSNYYNVIICRDGVCGPATPYRITSNTFDPSTATPLNATPVVDAPTGDTTYARTDGGNMPFTGEVRAKSINKVRHVCEFTGTNLGEKITAAFADVASTGGVIDARCAEGSQTLGTLGLTTSSKPIHIILGAGTYTGDVTLTQGNFILEGQGRAATTILGSVTVASSSGGQGRNEIKELTIQNPNGTTSGAVLTFTGSSFAYYNNLHNVFVNATAPNGTSKRQYGIRVNDNITTSVWDNVQVYGASSHGIYIDASSAAFTYNYNQWNSVVANTNGGWGVYLVGNSSSPFLANKLNVDAEGNGSGGIYQKDVDGTKFDTIYLENNGCTPYVGICSTGYGLWIDGTYARGFNISGGFNVGSGTALKVTANFAMGVVSGHRLGGTTNTLDLQPVNTASSIVLVGVRRDGTNDTAATTTSMTAGVVSFRDRFQGRATNIYGVPGGASAPVYAFSSGTTTGMDYNSSVGPMFIAAGVRGMGVFASGPVIPSSGQYRFATSALADSGSPTFDLGLTRSAAGLLKITNGSTGDGALQVPAIRSGSASNTDLAGQLTLSAGSATYNFTGSYTSAPICVATDTTAANAVKASATTTVLTITGTGTDVINYICAGRN